VLVESTVSSVQDHRGPLSIEALADAKRAADTLITSGVCNLHEVQQLRGIIDRIDAAVRVIREEQDKQE
jgi:signal-transduction protein with cAMP-binding, CBS, and nucleotidyltransferase domain